jgi:hypothetical protein
VGENGGSDGYTGFGGHSILDTRHEIFQENPTFSLESRYIYDE